MDGADVFYVAPKFHDWEFYLQAFEDREIIDHSLVLRPTTIRNTMINHSIPDGRHKVAYGNSQAYLCSEPQLLEPFRASDLVKKVEVHVRSTEVPIGSALESLWEGFSKRSSIRREGKRERPEDGDRKVFAIPSYEGRQSDLRQARLTRFQGSGRSRNEAIALAVGAEAWSLGAQLIFVTAS